MADLSKYEIILEELKSLENQISAETEKNAALKEAIIKLEDTNRVLQDENFVLKERIKDLELKSQIALKSSSGDLTQSLNKIGDNEELKIKLKELINKINFHLSS